MTQAQEYRINSIISALEFKQAEIMKQVIEEIKELLPENGEPLQLENEGFEDDAGNDITGVSREDIICNYGGTVYGFTELSFFEGIRLLEAIRDELKATVKP